MSVYQESRRFTLFIFLKRPRVLFFFFEQVSKNLLRYFKEYIATRTYFHKLSKLLS